MTKPGKLIIFCAPSGSGKSTLVQWLMAAHPELHLAFSISCTSRPPRGTEQNGVEYFFISPDEFRQRVAADEFLEYEEVYEGRFYGTLKSQVDTQTQRGENVLFDVDVKGGCNIKDFYGDRALSIFVQPPSIDELRRRLVHVPPTPPRPSSSAWARLPTNLPLRRASTMSLSTTTWSVPRRRSTGS